MWTLSSECKAVKCSPHFSPFELQFLLHGICFICSILRLILFEKKQQQPPPMYEVGESWWALPMQLVISDTKHHAYALGPSLKQKKDRTNLVLGLGTLRLASPHLCHLRAYIPFPHLLPSCTLSSFSLQIQELCASELRVACTNREGKQTNARAIIYSAFRCHRLTGKAPFLRYHIHSVLTSGWGFIIPIRSRKVSRCTEVHRCTENLELLASTVRMLPLMLETTDSQIAQCTWGAQLHWTLFQRSMC